MMVPQSCTHGKIAQNTHTHKYMTECTYNWRNLNKLNGFYQCQILRRGKAEWGFSLLLASYKYVAVSKIFAFQWENQYIFTKIITGIWSKDDLHSFQRSDNSFLQSFPERRKNEEKENFPTNSMRQFNFETKGKESIRKSQVNLNNNAPYSNNYKPNPEINKTEKKKA